MKKGIAASKGYAIGHVVIKTDDKIKILDTIVEDIEAENARLESSY